jgi:hypothetical protein
MGVFWRFWVYFGAFLGVFGWNCGGGCGAVLQNVQKLFGKMRG